MNIEQEIIENFKDYFKNADVSIDISGGREITGGVSNVKVSHRQSEDIYDITFSFAPETKVEITSR